LPVLIDGTGEILPKHGFVLRGRREIVIRIFDPVYPEAFQTDDPMELAARFKVLMAERLEEARKGIT
jgi:hypothetical protein